MVDNKVTKLCPMNCGRDADGPTLLFYTLGKNTEVTLVHPNGKEVEKGEGMFYKLCNECANETKRTGQYANI